MLLQLLQRLLKHAPHRTSAHLEPQVLAIGLVARPRDLSVVNARTAQHTPRPKELEPHLECRAQSYNFNHCICAPPIREFLDSLVEALAVGLEVPGLSSERFGEFET